jgi:hypothetical protein
MFLGSEIFKKEVMNKINNTFSEPKSKEIINQKMKKPFLRNNLSDEFLKKKEETINEKNFSIFVYFNICFEL